MPAPGRRQPSRPSGGPGGSMPAGSPVGPDETVGFHEAEFTPLPLLRLSAVWPFDGLTAAV